MAGMKAKWPEVKKEKGWRRQAHPRLRRGWT